MLRVSFVYVHLSGWNSIDADLVPLLIRVKLFKMEDLSL